MAIDFGKVAEGYKKKRLRSDCSQFQPRIPWKCTDCLDSGVAGRGTQQAFCNCEAGKEFKAEVFTESAEGLDEKALAGVKLTNVRD